MVTHGVRVETIDQLDRELIRWLKRADQEAGHRSHG